MYEYTFNNGSGVEVSLWTEKAEFFLILEKEDGDQWLNRCLQFALL